MSGKKIRLLLLITLAVFLVAGSVFAFMWFKPHRDVQATTPFAELDYLDLLHAFENDQVAANGKFLSNDGNSKVLVISGPVFSISENQAGEKIITIKGETDKAGVSVTFIPEAGEKVKNLHKGDMIKVKGQIISGNSYDADLDLYEHAVLIQADFY